MAEVPLETDNAAGTIPPFEADFPGGEGGTGSSPPLQQAATSGPVLLRDRYLVDTGAPLPHLDSPSAKAYSVEDRRDLGNKLFALVCTPDLPTRIEIMQSLKNDPLPGMLQLIDWDVALWPPLGQKTMIVIYALPLGGRVVERLAKKEVRITEYDIPRRVVEPVAAALQRLSAFESAHRAVRPNNIFFMDEEMTEVVIGENVTSPPGFDQHRIYEPLDRSMADPSGRGAGSSADDIYALGATIGIIMLGHNPVAKIKDDEVIQKRLEQGSYNAIFGTARVPLPLLEPMRGMMNDDEATRWTFNEVSNWLLGQKIDHPQKKVIRKADTPFTFLGRDHYSPRTLAFLFSRNPGEAMRSIRDPEFEAWLKRGLDDKDKAEALVGALHSGKFHKDGYQGSDEYLLCKICALLDPEAPVRYKELSFLPDGFGPTIAHQIVQNSNAQIAGEILNHEILALWFSMRSTPLPGMSDLTTTLKQYKGFLAIKDLGYGIERVLYEANSSLPCQSPLVTTDCVVQIEHLLPAMNAASNKADTSSRPLDRDIAAFIAARFSEDIHPHLKAIASSVSETSIVGLLSLFAFLQWKLRQSALLGLASWIGGQLGPAIASYHNRFTREELEKEIPRLVRKGSLPELFDLVDNAERREEDRDGFTLAKAEWLAAEEEIRDIEGSGDERTTKAERSGQQAAAMISIVLTLTVISVLAVVEFV